MTHDDALKLIEAVDKLRAAVSVGTCFIMALLYFISTNIRRLK